MEKIYIALKKAKMTIRLVFLLICLCITCIVNGQNTIIKGIVTDSITGEALPYVSVLLKGTTRGTATDDKVRFNLTENSTVKIMTVSYLGYGTKELSIVTGKTNSLKMALVPNGIALNEVIIKPK